MAEKQEVIISLSIITCFTIIYFFGHNLLYYGFKFLYYFFYQTPEGFWIKAAIFVILGIILAAMIFYFNDRKLEEIEYQSAILASQYPQSLR